MLLKDKTAIIYGGSGAVGGAVAKVFAREGARVFLAARGVGPLEAVAEDIRAAGGRAEVAPVDARDREAVAEHFAEIANRAGPVKLMFNGIEWGDTQGQPIVETDLERLLRPIKTSLTSWLHTGTIAAGHMAENGGGRSSGSPLMRDGRRFRTRVASVSPARRSNISCACWRSRTGRWAYG